MRLFVCNGFSLSHLKELYFHKRAFPGEENDNGDSFNILKEQMVFHISSQSLSG